jgi:hypothetical protein
MATDMDIDMDIDVGLTVEELAIPEIVLLPSAIATVSPSISTAIRALANKHAIALPKW